MNVNICEDNEITNFREICMGKIPGRLLYRGSYPIMSMEPKRDKAYNQQPRPKAEPTVRRGIKPLNTNKNNIIGLDIHFLFDFKSKKRK
jgi:hypothetical protein